MNEKPFVLAPPPMDFAEVVPKARRVVAFNKTLTLGARLLFAVVTDFSLWPGVNTRAGVVRKPNSFWARKFGVSEKTVQNWKAEIVAAGDVWLTERWMKNSYPETVYHVTAIVGPAPVSPSSESDDGSRPEDDDEPVSNRRRSRTLFRDPTTGKWARGGSKTVETPKTAVSSQNADFQDRSGKELPSSAATSCRSERQPVAAPSGKPLPLSPESHCRGERQPVAALDGKPLPLGAAIDCRGPRKPVADKGEVQKGESRHKSGGRAGAPPGLNAEEAAFRKWEGTLDKLFHRELREIKADLRRGLATSQSETGRALMRRKLKAVEERLTGPQPAEETAPASPKAPAAKPKGQFKPLSAEFIADAKRKAGLPV